MVYFRSTNNPGNRGFAGIEVAMSRAQDFLNRYEIAKINSVYTQLLKVKLYKKV